ncbi:MAG: hypothetical protein GY793_07600 [Proteobacteria bacterium]|nr:hypothetical protein [Pseudomonadota bacterium]
MENSWIYFCLFASLFFALSWGLNGVFKVNAFRLSFWRGVIVSIILAPSLFFVDLPDNLIFYLGFLGLGFIGYIADTIVFHTVKIYKGSGPTRFMNLRIPISLILGWILFPTSWYAIVNHGVLFTSLVIISIVIATLSLFFMTQNPIAKKMVLLMSFPLVIFITIDFMTKYLFGIEGTLGLTIVSIFFMSSGMLFCSVIGIILSKTPIIDKNENTVRYSSYIALSWIGLMVCKQIVMLYASNPGYYSLFVSSSFLWIMLYHKLKKEKDELSPVAGLILFICTVVLISLINFL